MNGTNFPPKTIYELVICIQMYLEQNGIFWKLLDDKDKHFISLKYTCDNAMKERAESGLGNVVRQAEVLSYDQESLLWDNGFLGTENPEQVP